MVLPGLYRNSYTNYNTGYNTLSLLGLAGYLKKLRDLLTKRNKYTLSTNRRIMLATTIIIPIIIVHKAPYKSILLRNYITLI
jgi:hypothetical protein